jgi:hypothetical protein
MGIVVGSGIEVLSPYIRGNGMVELMGLEPLE